MWTLKRTIRQLLMVSILSYCVCVSFVPKVHQQPASSKLVYSQRKAKPSRYSGSLAD